MTTKTDLSQQESTTMTTMTTTLTTTTKAADTNADAEHTAKTSTASKLVDDVSNVSETTATATGAGVKTTSSSMPSSAATASPSNAEYFTIYSTNMLPPSKRFRKTFFENFMTAGERGGDEELVGRGHEWLAASKSNTQWAASHLPPTIDTIACTQQAAIKRKMNLTTTTTTTNNEATASSSPSSSPLTSDLIDSKTNTLLELAQVALDVERPQ